MGNRALIYSANPQSPHLETDLELACRLKSAGKEVVLLRCTGQLKSCLVNPKHNKLICLSCNSKYKNALNAAQMNDFTIVTIPDTAFDYKQPPASFDSVDDLKAFKFNGASLGIPVVSTLVGRLYDHKFDTIKYRKEVNVELKMCIELYLALQLVLNKIKPDEIYFFNGRFSIYYPLKALCISRGIVFYTHERAGVNNKFISRKNTIPHDKQYCLEELNDLWNKADESDRKNLGSKFFSDRRNKVVQSWVSFTTSQKLGLLPIGFDLNKKNIMVFNSTMEEYEGMEDWKNTIYDDDNIGIARIVEAFSANNEYVFYLRVHPNMKFLRNSQMKELEAMALKYKNLYLIRPEDQCDSYALIDNAYKVVTFGSTVGVEATYWNRVSILCGQSFYMNIDACYQPANHKEVVGLLRNDSLLPKDQINAIKYAYWELMKGEYYKKFKQVDLFKMECDGVIIEASKPLQILEKFAKIGLIRNKRGLNNFVTKTKNFLKW